MAPNPDPVDPLLIYYGYPSLINGSESAQDSLEHFEKYARVVLGDGLQNPNHPDHPHSKWLIASLEATQFFGYIDLGVYSPHHPMQNLSIQEIESRAVAWKELGARGILLDDYGYDFAVTRERQTLAVETLHRLGLSVIANSWDPRHALDPMVCEANPKGTGSPLKSGDFYLYESYLISNGEWTHFKRWRAKANTLNRLLKAHPVGVVSTTTTLPGVTLTQQDLEFTYHCAWMEGHQAFAWGEPSFAAADNLAPWRPRPEPIGGQGKIGKTKAAPGEAIQCTTPEGRIIADYVRKKIYLDSRQSWWQRL